MSRYEALRQKALELLERSGAPPRLSEELRLLEAELEVQGDELRESQQKAFELASHYRQLFFGAPFALLVLAEDETLLEYNAEADALLGGLANAGRLTFSHLLGADSRARWKSMLSDAQGGTELALRSMQNKPLLCRVSVSDRGSRGTLVSLVDLTAQRQAELAQRQASERASRLVRDTVDGVLFVDRGSGLITEANVAMGALLGRSAASLRDATLESLYPPDEAARLSLVIPQALRDRHNPVALRLMGKGGVVEVEATVGELVEGPSRIITLLVRDLSGRHRLEAERKELAGRALEAQKLAAVGQLAAGVAHDMNNVLAGILACSSSPFPTDPKDLVELLEEVQACALRGRELTGRLTALFRRRPLRTARFDFHQVLGELQRLLQHTFPGNIELRFESEPGCFADGDEGAWHQALLNLAINARDAMPGGGQLSVRCRKLDEAIDLSVTDTGHGMSEDVRRHAFEPFFTTRSNEGGTGLGLAHVHAVATSHRAVVMCQSAPGKGTSFHFHVPASRLAPVEPPPHEHETPMGGRLLLVDDDALVLRATARLLSRMGPEVVTAGSAREALIRLEQGPAFDVVLSDLHMPGISGEQLMRGIRDRWPALSLVLYTGEVRDEQVVRLRDSGVKGVIHKPFDAKELRAALVPLLPRKA